jgi:hypothetical protein
MTMTKPILLTLTTGFGRNTSTEQQKMPSWVCIQVHACETSGGRYSPSLNLSVNPARPISPRVLLLEFIPGESQSGFCDPLLGSLSHYNCLLIRFLRYANSL